jgi:hypothetical protein
MAELRWTSTKTPGACAPTRIIETRRAAPLAQGLRFIALDNAHARADGLSRRARGAEKAESRGAAAALRRALARR